MDKHEIEKLKRQVNIVDIIGQYVRLKKNGKNHSACCPFHSEKTASFTVSEDKQFYHCFGCGEHGDVLDWLTRYCGMDFKDAIKSLGGEIDMTPPEKIMRNEKRTFSNDRKPADHAEDAEMSEHVIKKCTYVDGYYKSAIGKVYLPLMTADGELKNLVYFESYDKANPCFIAGAPSYDCFYRIQKKDSDKWLAVTSIKEGYAIAKKYGVNVAVCFTEAVMKYVCKWNSGELKIMPALTGNEDGWLAYEMNHCFWDGEKLERRMRIND